MALSTSVAIVLESATRSWLARERRRTRRPYQVAGMTTNTTVRITCSITVGCDQTNTSKAPKPITTLRSPIESDEPTTVCTSVVSAIKRLVTSPAEVVSKNSGLCCSTCR